MKRALAAILFIAASFALDVHALAQSGCRDCGVVRSVQQIEQ